MKAQGDKGEVFGKPRMLAGGSARASSLAGPV
jgi:hypothetical protein